MGHTLVTVKDRLELESLVEKYNMNIVEHI